MNLNVRNLAVTSIVGLLSITILTSIWAIFGRINFEFHICLLIINIFFFLYHKIEIACLYKDFISEIKDFDKNLKILLGIISIFIIAQCASAPFIIDNESYYIQTIKWINEYGFVKGLGNLHLFLAQTSGWHITQSAFSFSFLHNSFNDLSGYCLLLGNIFAIQKLNKYFKGGDKSLLIIGFFPLANIMLFQFISSPSPDIPIYVFSFIVFSYFLENHKKMDAATFSIITIFVIFCMYIKTTAIALCILPLFIWIQNIKKINIIKISVLSFIVLLLFITKNTIISGHPFFPVIKNFESLTLDFQIPEKIASFYYNNTRAFAFYVTESEFANMSRWELFIKWITLPKLHGLFNKISVLFVFTTPFILYKYLSEKKYWILYLIMLSQLIILFLSSPQYRFFLNFIILISFFLMSLLIKTKKYILFLNYCSVITISITVFIPLNFNTFTKNKHTLSSSNFSYQNIIFPYDNSKYKTVFTVEENENLKYYSPKNIDFFWGTGDGPLPTVKKEYIDYFDNHYRVKPQMRTKNIEDGFFAKKTSKDKK